MIFESKTVLISQLFNLYQYIYEVDTAYFIERAFREAHIRISRSNTYFTLNYQFTPY